MASYNAGSSTASMYDAPATGPGQAFGNGLASGAHMGRTQHGCQPPPHSIGLVVRRILWGKAELTHATICTPTLNSYPRTVPRQVCKYGLGARRRNLHHGARAHNIANPEARAHDKRERAEVQTHGNTTTERHGLIARLRLGAPRKYGRALHAHIRGETPEHRHTDPRIPWLALHAAQTGDAPTAR